MCTDIRREQDFGVVGTLLLPILVWSVLAGSLVGCGTNPFEDPHAVNERALDHLAAGRSSEAAAVLRTATQKWPQELPLWLNLAHAYLAENRKEDALEAYDQALGPILAANSNPTTEVSLDFLDGFALLAIELQRSRWALDRLGQLPVALKETPFAQLGFARLLAQERRYAESLKAFERARTLWVMSGSDGAQSAPGESRRDVGREALVGRVATLAVRDGVRANIDAALAELAGNETNSEHRLHVATTLLTIQRYDEALLWATGLTESAPELGRGWHLRALALEGLGRMEEAVPLLREAWKATQPDPEGAVHYAALMLKRGLDDEALIALEWIGQSFEGNSTSPTVDAALGALYARRGDEASARRTLERALRAAPDDRDVRKLYEKVTGTPAPSSEPTNGSSADTGLTVQSQ